MSKSSRAVLLIIAFIAGLVITFVFFRWSWPALTRPYAATAAPKISTSSGKPSDAVVAKFWIGSARVTSSCVSMDLIHPCPRIDIVFENRSREPITNLRFDDFKAPGFQQSGNCWKDNRPICRQGADSEKTDEIEAGRSIHFWAELKPAASTGRFGLLAIYHWDQPSGGVFPSSAGKGGKKVLSKSGRPLTQRSGAISLQPIEITSPLHEAIGTAQRILLNLALPIALAILAWLFGNYDRVRSERAEVWKEQLGRVFEYTQNHYMAISSNISAFERYATDTLRFDRAFYHFAMLWLQVRRLKLAKGGWFLSTRQAEDILALGWKLVLFDVRDRLGGTLGMEGDIVMESVSDIVQSPESVAHFLVRLGAGDAEGMYLCRVRDDLNLWSKGVDGSFKSTLAMLTVIGIVLRYEWDRPFYRHWYHEHKHFESNPFDKCLTNIRQTDSELQRFVKMARAYCAYVRSSSV